MLLDGATGDDSLGDGAPTESDEQPDEQRQEYTYDLCVGACVEGTYDSSSLKTFQGAERVVVRDMAVDAQGGYAIIGEMSSDATIDGTPVKATTDASNNTRNIFHTRPKTRKKRKRIRTRRKTQK